jgi:hypothetical protein
VFWLSSAISARPFLVMIIFMIFRISVRSMGLFHSGVLQIGWN